MLTRIRNGQMRTLNSEIDVPSSNFRSKILDELTKNEGLHKRLFS